MYLLKKKKDDKSNVGQLLIQLMLVHHLQVAIKRIASGKWGPCSGQACVGIDYILVEHQHASKLVRERSDSIHFLQLQSYLCLIKFFLNFSNSQIDLLKKTIKKFYGENMGSLKNLCKIVNKHHFNRLHNLLEDPAVAASIVYGGSLDEQNL